MGKFSTGAERNYGCVATLSGGLDSTVALAMARLLSPIAKVVTFDYGQKAATKEVEASSKIAKYYDIPHEVIRYLKETYGKPLQDVMDEDVLENNIEVASSDGAL